MSEDFYSSRINTLFIWKEKENKDTETHKGKTQHLNNVTFLMSHNVTLSAC